MSKVDAEAPASTRQKRAGTHLLLRRVLPAFLIILAGCAGAPVVTDKSESYVSDVAQKPSSLHKMLPPEAMPSSGVMLLADPFEALLTRLQLVDAAISSLDLQYYLWQSDTVGIALTEAFLRAADRGVRVRLLLDDIYHSGRDEVYQTLDSHPNIQVRLFNPMGNRGAAKTANYALRKAQFNNRMHNKIFLADGQAAVLGGRNIGDEYFGLDSSFNFQDLDVLVTGDGAREAGEAFDLFWNATLAVPIDTLYPNTDLSARLVERAPLRDAARELTATLERSGVTLLTASDWTERMANELTWTEAQVLVDRPDRSAENPETAFAVFASDPRLRADREVTIQTAYLIPNGPTMGTLTAFAERGVSLKILTNSAASNNHGTVHAYYMPYRAPLINAGVELYELRATGDLSDYLSRNQELARAGLHTKAMVIDQEVSVIGSYNMDPRSRVWNTEIALLVFSDGIAAEVLEEMARDFTATAAWRVTLNEKGKPVWSGEVDGTPVQLDKEPDTHWWQRFLWSVLRILPLENEM